MITTYTFSRKEDLDDIKIPNKLKEEMDDDYQIHVRVDHDDEEDPHMKAKVFSLENQVRELTERLKDAKALDTQRIREIDKWHKSYEQAQTEISVWQSQYEKMRDANKKAEYEYQDVHRLKSENTKLQESIVLLKNQLDKDSMIVATAKKYIGDSPLTPDVILNRFAYDEEYKKREKALEDKIKELQDKLGDKSVLLSVLAEGIKDFAEEKNIEEAHTLFEHLCYILIEEKGWTDNVADLKKFFKNARREMEKRQITMTGEHATYNENNK